MLTRRDGVQDDVVCLPPKQARSLGGMGQFSVVRRVGTSIHLMDPFTLACTSDCGRSGCAGA